MNQLKLFTEKKLFTPCINAVNEKAYHGQPCFVGFDLSAEQRIYSYVMLFPSAAGKSTAIFRNFHPDQNAGIIILESIWNQILADAKNFNFQKVVFDRWGGNSIKNNMREIMSCDFVDTGSSFASMSWNTKRLKHLIEKEMIVLCGVEAFDLYVIEDESGNVKPRDKNFDNAFHGIAALIFAMNSLGISGLDKFTLELEEKIKAFNLLPMSSAMISFVHETFPETVNMKSFDYVKFYRCQPYFYSKSYIQEHTIDELMYAFTSAYLR